MRHLADHDVISRAACYHTLNDMRTCGKMPLHVILSCNNRHLKEVSELTHSKHFAIDECQFSISKHPSISTTNILDLIHAGLAQFTKYSTLRLYREQFIVLPFCLMVKVKVPRNRLESPERGIEV
jgi:hypothetical protein